MARPPQPRRALLGWAAGCALWVAACGGLRPGATQDAARPAALPKQIAWAKTAATEERDRKWRDLFTEAEQATGIKVELVIEPTGFWDKRQTEYAAGSANMDVMYNQLNWVLLGGLRGMFADLSPFLRRDKIDSNQYYKADFESWSWKGKLWAITYQAGGECVHFNKQLFNAKGVKHPHKDWTYDDFLQMCLRLNEPAANRFAVVVSQNGLQYMMGTFVRNFGGKVLNEQRHKALYGDDPNSIRGAELDVDLHTRYKVTPSAEALGTLPPGLTPMRARMVAMEFNYIGGHVAIRPDIGAEHYDVVPPPKGPTGIQQARVAGNSWSVNSLSKAVEGGWAVLKWLHSKEGMLGKQLEVISWPPTIWAATSSQWLAQFKGTRIEDVQRVWQTAGHNQVVLPEGDVAIQTMNEPMNRALRGEIITRNAMRESADKLNQLFSQRPPEWN